MVLDNVIKKYFERNSILRKNMYWIYANDDNVILIEIYDKENFI